MPFNKQDLLTKNEDEFSLPTIPEEELQRFTLDEDLSETERVKVLLTKKDQPAQQQYVFTNAVNIFKDNPQGIQQQVLPIIISGISTYSEQIQIEAGKAFIQLLEQDVRKLLANFSKIIEPQFYKDLKNLCQVMLKQWSKAILTEWICVYLNLIIKLQQPSLTTECIDNAFKLLENHQPASVKESAAYFIGLMAKKKFINQTDTSLYVDKFYPKIIELVNYPNWKVRISICRQMVTIAEYLSEFKTIELICPLLKQMIGDSEQDVQKKAIKQMFKIITLKIVSQEFTSSLEFSQLLKHILGIAVNSLSLKNSVIKSIGSLIKHLDPQQYGNDRDFEQILISFLKTGRQSEFGRLFLPSIFTNLIHLYQLNGRFAEYFYQELIQDYIQSELMHQGLTKDIKKEIAQNLPHYLLSSIKSQSDKATYDIANKCNLILQNTNREIVNEFVMNIYQVFQYLHDFRDSINSRLKDMLNQLIKKPLLENLEPIIIQNWRFHLNFFQTFLSKYLIISDQQEALFPIFINGLKNPKASLPVKKYAAEFFAELIETQPNQYLRLSIQNALLNDFAASSSSQLRQVFVYFLEVALGRISKTYFKQVFFNAYLALSNDQVYSIQSHFIQLAPQVRQKLDDIKSIEALINALNSVQSDKDDIKATIKLALSQLKDPKFLQQVQMHQVTVEFEITQREHQLREKEKTHRGSDGKKSGESSQSGMSGGSKTEMSINRGRNFIIGQPTLQQATKGLIDKEEEKSNPFKARRGSNSGLKVFPSKLAPHIDKMASKTPQSPLKK